MPRIFGTLPTPVSHHSKRCNHEMVGVIGSPLSVAVAPRWMCSGIAMRGCWTPFKRGTFGAFSPDEQLLASRSREYTAQLWNPTSCRRHVPVVGARCFHPQYPWCLLSSSMSPCKRLAQCFSRGQLTSPASTVFTFVCCTAHRRRLRSQCITLGPRSFFSTCGSVTVWARYPCCSVLRQRLFPVSISGSQTSIGGC